MRTQPPGHAVGTKLVLADAHVHIYGCFDVPRFFGAAWTNLRRQAGERSCTGMLLFTETVRDQWFMQLDALAERGEPVGAAAGTPWRPERTGEPESLRVLGPQGAELVAVAGRQIETAERLEVLALGTTAELRDGRPLAETVDRVRAAGALPVIPWGFGKWWGGRGALLRDYLNTAPIEDLFLGDNGGRPKLGPAPGHFGLAAARGIRILPGSDPLPLASECRRPGSYGFSVEAPVDLERPWASLKAALARPDCVPRPFGERETASRFIRNQVYMQFDKRWRRG